MGTVPSRVLTSPVDEFRPTRGTVIGRDRFASRHINRTAALHTRIRNDGHTVRTDVEIVDCEVAQGFELFIEDILVDDRLTTVARFHDDAIHIT
jgi:hypothetical protein